MPWCTAACCSWGSRHSAARSRAKDATRSGVVGERFDTAEPARREEAAQPTAHVRLCDAGLTPQKLTDLIEAPWARRLVAGEDQTAILHRCCAHDAAEFRDAPDFGDKVRDIADRLEHRVAKDRVERRLGKRQPSSVGSGAKKVLPSHYGSIAAGGRQAVLCEIDADDCSGRQCLGQADRDRRSVATAVEDQHVRLQLPQKKASIDVGAAGLDLPLNVASLSRPIRDDPLIAANAWISR